MISWLSLLCLNLINVFQLWKKFKSRNSVPDARYVWYSMPHMYTFLVGTSSHASAVRQHNLAALSAGKQFVAYLEYFFNSFSINSKPNFIKL